MVGLGHTRIATLSAGVVLALVAMLGSAAQGGTAYAQDGTKRFEWPNDMRVGDCTMFHGVVWTLVYDGTATFDGTVTSGSNNDAWLMHAQLLSDRKALGYIVAQQRNVDDITRFVQNLPDKHSQYRWHIDATFDPAFFNEVRHMNLQAHC